MASISGLIWKEVLTWCHKLSTWPSRTHSSCTDTLRYSPVGISIHTYRKTEVPQYIPGGNRLIFSRKINLIRPNREQDIEAALRGRFPDLAQDNFHTGLVHLSYYLTEPVAHPGWNIRLVIAVVEDDITSVVLFKAALSTYEGLGAIYVPPHLNKQILITETGLDIVCGPQGELCNGFQLDFVSCWLVEEDSVPTAPEVRNMACAGRDQPRLSSRHGLVDTSDTTRA